MCIKLDFNFKNSLTPLCEQKLKSSSAQGEEIIIYVFLTTERFFRDQEECLLLFFFHQLFFASHDGLTEKKEKDNVLKNCNHINSVALRLPLLGVFCAKSQIPNQKIKAQCSTYFPLENFREEKMIRNFRNCPEFWQKNTNHHYIVDGVAIDKLTELHNT